VTSDKDEIIELTVAYCWALDTRQYDELSGVFLPDATAELGRSLHGIEAIKGRVAEALDPLDASQHMVATHQVKIDGDRATGRTYLQAQHIKAGALFMVGGRYDDRFVRTSAGWRIEHRELTVLWTDGDAAVLQRDA